MKGSEIVSRARLVLNDADASRWADTEFALWITDGCSLIALRRPDSVAITAALTLTAGSKQSIAGMSPAGMRLLDVHGLRLVDRETLDCRRPGWQSSANSTPTSWVFDNREPKVFWVYPPAASGSVQVLYAPKPAAFTSGNLASLDLPFDDAWAGTLLDYVLFRAYAKDSDVSHNANLAASYLSSFENMLGGKAQADVAFSPDLNSTGGSPSSGAAAGGA